MDYDLLFTLSLKNDWKDVSSSGYLVPTTQNEDGYLVCLESNELEKYTNSTYPDTEELLLIVIDPLRIQSPIKKVKEGEYFVLQVFGAIPLDAIIDKIPLKKGKNGFSIHIKHHD